MQIKNIFYLLDTVFIAVSKTHFLLTKNAKKMSTSWRTNSIKTFLTQLTVGVSKKYVLKNTNLYLEFIETKIMGY